MLVPEFQPPFIPSVGILDRPVQGRLVLNETEADGIVRACDATAVVIVAMSDATVFATCAADQAAVAAADEDARELVQGRLVLHEVEAVGIVRTCDADAVVIVEATVFDACGVADPL